MTLQKKKKKGTAEHLREERELEFRVNSGHLSQRLSSHRAQPSEQPIAEEWVRVKVGFSPPLTES